MTHRNLDKLQFSVKSVPFNELARQMRKHCAVDMSTLSKLIRGLGIVDLHSENNPTIFYVVTSETIDSVPSRGSKDTKEAVLFGVSPAIALSEDEAKAKFLNIVRRSNESLEL